MSLRRPSINGRRNSPEPWDQARPLGGVQHGTSHVQVPSKPIMDTFQHTPSSQSVAILVMGLTGAGKSTFISQLTQQEVEVGHSLESCTKDAMGYEVYRHNGQKVFLIDTPGFDDTHADNSKVLRQIASFVCAICDGECLTIGGLIYVHRITDTRMAGSSLKSLRVFEEICGFECFRDITILTTMWTLLQTERSQVAAEQREKMLCKRPEFFGKLIDGGATMIRHQGSYRDALDVIEGIASKNRNVVLRLQEEMLSNNKMTLAETSAGRFLEGELANTRKKYSMEMQELQQLESEMLGDDAMVESIREQMKDWSERLQASEIYQRSLLITRDDMARERKEWIYKTGYDTDAVHSIEEESVQLSALESQLYKTRMERDRLLQEKNAQRQEDLARIEERNQEIEALRKRLDDQSRKEKMAKERIDKLKSFSYPFMEFVRATFSITPAKESSNLARRSEPTPAEEKHTKRSWKRSSKKPGRSKGRKAEKSGRKAQTSSHNRQPDPESNVALQQVEMDSSDSEEFSEDEDMNTAQYMAQTAMSEPESPSSETSPSTVLGKPAPRLTTFDPANLPRIYPPVQRPGYMETWEAQRITSCPQCDHEEY